jgi:hypothetical protein
VTATSAAPAATTAAGPRPRVLALDLSITATGYALPDGQTGLFKGPWKGDWRLVSIKSAVAGHADSIDLAVIEDLPTHAKAAGITGMVHGAVRAVLLEAGVPYVLITPATLKAFATGKGNADKTAMAIAALKRADREFDGRQPVRRLVAPRRGPRLVRPRRRSRCRRPNATASPKWTGPLFRG